MTEFKDNKRLFLLMVPTALFWAGAFIAGKIAVAEFSLFTLTFIRFLTALVIVFPLMIKYEPDRWKISFKEFPIFILTGFLGIFTYHVLFFIALTKTTAINSSLIGATNPMATTIIAALFLNERIGLKRAGAILLAFMGVLLTASRGNIEAFTTMRFNSGDVLMLCAVIAFAVYSVVSKKIMIKYSPIIILTYSFLTAVIMLIPFVIMERPISYLHGISIKAWGSVFYMGIFASAIGYLLQQYAIKAYGASKTMLFVNLVPVFSIIISVIILKETVNLITLISAVIIITGVYLSSRLNK
ncbi:DMT family transporter [Cellulosilyticum sp. I15G10I2]|uniref:DMT family transporter n=1 Tax=Cellulosilyticum sp. I15G10I2 TaxID=1892843 RepID=UPI001495ED96|nr:DMT family transporter [Cellulosilyticum sp. I15G10I2]